MDKEEIARRIATLSHAPRNELYRLCEIRKRKNKNGVDVAAYEKISEDAVRVLKAENLVWRIGWTRAAARHDVYEYWEKHVYGRELQPAE